MISGVSAPAVATGARSPRDSAIGTRTRLLIYGACTLFAVICNYALGKELAWDVLNYHVYAGFSAVHDRLAQDYFAAGPQSYLNPYVYLPFYLLASSGLPALAVGSVLAIAHSAILWLTFELAIRLRPSAAAAVRIRLGLAATALAAVNPILLQQIGSSFADITTAEVVLAGWVMLAAAVHAPTAARILGAAALLGAAAALKPTNALAAIAGTAVLLLLRRPLRERLRDCWLYVAGVGVGFAVFAAPWAIRMWMRFRNPFFPLLNGVFRSPEFTTETLRHYRFIPTSLAAALWRPFAMLDPARLIHSELSSPDPRYALLVVLLCALAGRWLWRRFARGGAPPTPRAGADDATLAAVAGGLAVAWVIWLAGSGNSRYFLAMACVAGAIAVALLDRLAAARPKTANFILILLLAAQIVQLSIGAELRSSAVPWNSGPWLEVQVPQRLATEPNLYLTIGIQSHSYIAAYLAPASGVVNFSGGYALGGTGANGEQVRALVRRYAPHLRFLTQGRALYADAARREPSVARIDGALGRFGLRADPSDCATITLRGVPAQVEAVLVDSAPRAAEPRAASTTLITCRIEPDTRDRTAELARARIADAVLDRVEDACPALFQPRRMVTEDRGRSWLRLYGNTDISLWISNGWVRFIDPLHGDDAVVLGRASDWIARPPRIACGLRAGHARARILN